jgi:pyruvate dehydrogenase E2 component (dihydrolipoamide acetyltransferase)
MSQIEDVARTFGEIEVTPLSKFQKVVGRRLTQSYTQIPHVTHYDDADVTALESFRKEMPSKISPLPFLMRALAKVLGEFPKFNASLTEDGSSLIMKRYVHIGVAVDGPLGLLVPVIRDVDRKDIATIAAELSEIIARARTKGLPMDDMIGGSITITSLGGIGGTGFTPIINQPELAILGVSPSVTKPVWNGNAFEPRLMMPLSLAYDHRVLNGAEVARLVRRLAALLAHPEPL